MIPDAMRGYFKSMPDVIIGTSSYSTLLLVVILLNLNWMISGVCLFMNMMVVIVTSWVCLDLRNIGLILNNVGAIVESVYSCYFFEKKCKL